MHLQEALDQLLAATDRKLLQEASYQLSTCYLSQHSLTQESTLLAYLAVRMPATYAALHFVLSQLPEPSSLLDMGAGPGTLWWVAHSLWNKVIPITAIEQNPHFIALGKKLGATPQWIKANIQALPPLSSHSWVVWSYSLGEIEKTQIPHLMERSWELAKQGVILLEPGTPRGYATMLQAREELIKRGGYVEAPCPHHNPCPLPQGDWCHFKVRLTRSPIHRLAKEGDLPFEDEPFTYAIIRKNPCVHQKSRLLAQPTYHSGHVTLKLCTPHGLEKRIYSKKQGPLYKKARKAKWGEQV